LEREYKEIIYHHHWLPEQVDLLSWETRKELYKSILEYKEIARQERQGMLKAMFG